MRGLDPQRERSAIVRHLVTPGLVEETEAILYFDELGSDTYVNLVGQLEPAGCTDGYKEIHRRQHREEHERAFEFADALELSGSTCAAAAKRLRDVKRRRPSKFASVFEKTARRG